MAEHTPTPWSLHDRWLMSPSGPVALASGYQDWVTAPGGDRFEEWKANAAFIVKAVNAHEALLEFFKWAMREGPWDGGDLDGGSIQDKAEALGLIVKTQYDAERHGVQSDFETGDEWFEYAPHIRTSVGTGKLT